MAYIGSSPTKVVSRQSANIFTYTATANQTAFTGSDANGNTLACTPSDIMVHMNGLRLEESDYTASTTTVTLGSGAAAGDEVTITAFVTFETADAYTKSASDTRYVNTTGDTMSGSLSVSTSGNSSLTLQTSSASNSVSTNFQSANRTYYAGVDIGGANSSFTVYDGTAGAERFRINSSGIVTMPNQPSFLATGPNAWTTVSSGSTSTMTMNSTYYNIGNHYNTSNYTFTCPVAGKYLFHLKTYVKLSTSDDDSNHAYTKIHKNGSLYASSYNIFGYYNLGDNDQNADVTVIMECSANDAITSAVQAASGNALYIPAASYFCGILIG